MIEISFPARASCLEPDLPHLNALAASYAQGLQWPAALRCLQGVEPDVASHAVAARVLKALDVFHI